MRLIQPIKVRGFEKVSFEQYCKDMGGNADLLQEYNDIKLPRRATKYSAGYDFFSPISFILQPGEQIKIPTGIKAYMLDDEALLLYIRSSIGFKFNVRLKNCVAVIDKDYYDNINNEGHIWVALVNEGDRQLEVHKGDALVQGIFTKFLMVDGDGVDEERQGGIGSTSN
jgi:dUTP pyrophosphatase